MTTLECGTSSGPGVASIQHYENFRSLVDGDLREVVRLESTGDYLLAEVILDSLRRLGQEYPEHTTRYAGELVLVDPLN